MAPVPSALLSWQDNGFRSFLRLFRRPACDRSKRFCKQGVELAVEYEPAVFISVPLVVEHEFPDVVRELRALPPAFPATSLQLFSFGSRRAHGPDRVGCCAQSVICYVRHCRSLPGGVGGFSGRAA